MPAQDVTSQTQERLDAKAEKVANQLADRLLAPFQDTLAKFEIAFPGISKRVAEVVNPDVIKAALSAEAARSIQGLISEGTEESLGKALAAIKELRSLVQSGGSAEIAAAKDLMGKNMVGPDARIFEGKDLGEIPALPANIMEILNSKCELSNDGRTVAETHRLVLVPASIDGKPLTLNALREFATEAGKGKDPSFYEQDWYDNEAFANKPLEKSTWVLEYETVAPKSENKTDAQQVALVEKLPNHRTAKILEHVGAMVFNDLENGARIYPSMYGRCEERSASGARVSAGSFVAGGLIVDGNFGGYRHAYLGRAVVRKLNT